ncbi:MAG: NAD(P)-dependent oxidoreductase [Sciscionella sp.]
MRSRVDMVGVATAAPGVTRIGWIGTGVMGGSMAGRLLEGGYAVTVTTRSGARAEGLLAAGASWAETPAEVAARSDVVFSMVGLPADVRDVILGPTGALGEAMPGAILVDMTTSEPSLAIEIADAATEKDVHVLDAPVSGGDVGARDGTLSIMVGGPPHVLGAVHPCLAELGSTIVHEGPHGAGQQAKLVNQVLVAGTMVALAEGLVYASRVGLDVETVLASVERGAAGSWALSNLAPRIVANDFAAGFYVDHLVKDLGIALAEAEHAKVALPGLALAKQLFVALQAAGHGRDGTQALVHAVAALSGLGWPPSSVDLSSSPS